MRKHNKEIRQDRLLGLQLLAASRKEWWLLATTFIAALLLNISAINHSLGLVLLGYLCTFSLSSPFSAFLALSASQTVADPVGSPLTLAQCLFIGWGIQFVIGFRKRKVDYRAFKKLLLWVIPYIVFVKLLNFFKWNATPSIDNFDLAIMVGSMAAWYAGQLQGRFTLALLCILVGAATSVMTFWLGIAGVSMEGISLAKGGQLMKGVGVGRGDGNFSGISISLAAISFLASGILTRLRIGRSRLLTRIVPYLCIGFFISSIPAVFATMSRGAVLTFFGGVGFVTLSALYLSNASRNRILVSAIAACLFGILAFNSADGLTRKYSDAMLNLSEKQMQHESMTMSRTGTWGGAWQEIVNSPFIGTTRESRVSVEGYLFDYASHNVWLDVGRGAGVMGMLWFTGFFFYPIVQVFSALPRYEALFFCTPFVIIFLVFMNLSVMNLKVYYLLWVLVIAASEGVGDNRLPAVPKRKKSKKLQQNKEQRFQPNAIERS